MICFSRKDLERIAGKVVAAYMRSVPVQVEDVYQVEPEYVAESMLHLSVEHFHLSRNGSILGMTAPMECGVEVFDNDMERCFYFLDGKTILIEQDLMLEHMPIGRYNYTVMHEVAHQILFRLEARILSKAALRQYPASEWDWGEWQADTLASALLMPENLVKKVMAYVRLPQRIYLLDSQLNPQEYRKFCDAAAIMGVSKTALAIRMKQLRLLEYNDLFCPGKIMDIFWEEDDTWRRKHAS